jgi:2,3-bisphosphoglycerate-dependent phosphoglycerate mutase
MKVLFLRHGQTATNVAAKVHRTNDGASLDKVGKAQARRLAIACREEGVQQLYCSPEKRAKQTAQIIATKLGIDVTDVAELGERNWGDWSGRPWEDIQSKLELMNLKERYEFVPPYGESWQDMDGRLQKALERITASTSPVVGVVTHGGALRALMPLLKGEPRETSFQYAFTNASITSFEFHSGKWKLLRENDVAHLTDER